MQLVWVQVQLMLASTPIEKAGQQPADDRDLLEGFALCPPTIMLTAVV